VGTVKFSEDVGLLHRDEKGVLRDNFSNRRVIIFSCSAYRSMCDALYDQFQSGAAVILYRMGEGYGRKLVKGVPQLGLSREEMIEAFEKLAHSAGWGKISIKITEEKNGEVIVQESAFLLRREDVGPISCHFLAGVLAGGASELLEGEYKGQEIRCASKEAGVCRFRIYSKGSEE
jgi:predicted hydrocarbon binding protein